MFLIAIPLLLRREPLAISSEKPAAGISSNSEPATEVSKAAATDPPSEPAKAAVEVEKSAVTPSGAPPLVIGLESRDADVGDVAMADAFEVVPRSGAGGKGGSFPLPSSAAMETAKDSAMAVVISSLPGPHQATLVCIPPYSGPTLDRLDASGHFPLAVLVEKRAKDQLADVALLRSSVEYALGNAAKEIATLKWELDAAKGTA